MKRSIALTLTLLASAAGLCAQEATPARQLGTGSTLLNPGRLDDAGAVKYERYRDSPELPPLPPDPVMAATTTAEGELLPWWEGMEEVADHSIRSGSWRHRAGISASWVHDDNFQLAAQGGGKRSTQVYAVSPYLQLSKGEPGHGLDFQFQYAPEYSTFSDASIDPILNHSISSSLGLNGARSRVLVNASYNRREGGNVEVGGLVSSDVGSIGLQASYDYSPKTSFGVSLGSSYTSYERFNSFADINLSAHVDYAATAKTRVGFGLGYNLVDQQRSRSQNAVNANLRLNWAASAKLSLSAALGGEFRSFAGGESIVTPNGTIAASYAPTAKLSLQLSLYRRATPSIVLQDSLYYATGGALTAAYNVTARASMTVGFGYELSPYESTVEGVRQDREDRYYFVRTGLSYSLRHNLGLNLFYQWSENDSNSTRAFNQPAGFKRSQVGASLSYLF